MIAPTVTTAWPSSLPLPVIAFNGQGVYSTVKTDVNGLVPAFRSRFKSNYPQLTLRFALVGNQFQSFRSFYQTLVSGSGLWNGICSFAIPLRFPYNTALLDWAVRFVDAYDATAFSPGWSKALWTVEANVELLYPMTPTGQMRITEDDGLRITQDGEIRTVA